MQKSGFFYKPVGGRRATDKPEEKKFAIDWWKILLVPALGWCTWVTFHGFLAESNRDDLEKLRTEKVAELKAYVDLQVGVLHGRITKEGDRINDLVWQFLNEGLEECQDDLEECTE